MQQQYDDEIDLFELAEELWREKLLILLVTFLITISASIYVVVSPTIYTYSAEVTLRKPSLHKYGQLAAAMQTEGKQGLEVATELANSGFSILRENLNSTSTISDFRNKNEQLKAINASASIPRGSKDIFILRVTSRTQMDLITVLNDYLLSTAQQTQEELNAFFAGMSLQVSLDKDMLYQIDVPSANKDTQSKPKKKLIVAVGFVVGGMLGIFVALLRSAIRKHRA